MPERVQLSRKKGWRMPPNTVKVCRPGPWGNPFRAGWGFCETAQDAVRSFRACMEAEKPNMSELHGKNLACWCKLGDPCHADVLLDLANESSNAALTRGAQADGTKRRR